MHRNKLLAQVKNEYQRLSLANGPQHFGQTADGFNASAYYDHLRSMVEKEISAGTFDSFLSGFEIVQAVKNDKTLLSQLKQ